LAELNSDIAARSLTSPAVSEPVHLQPTGPLAERVLLPGDPGRALLLAQLLLSEPKMFNHNRGLWGYTGAAKADGRPLTIQSTGMGGPSAAIVIAELFELGARCMLRVGTCGAFDRALKLGELLIVGRALSRDGTSAALGATDGLPPAPELLGALRAAGPELRQVTVASVDLFYDVDGDRMAGWRADGAEAIEMEAAALFALAARRGFKAAALLIVSDLLAGPPVRIETEALRAAEQRLGELAVLALSGR
jgi:DeoD family purine-nucleoside phosphorylase